MPDPSYQDRSCRRGPKKLPRLGQCDSVKGSPLGNVHGNDVHPDAVPTLPLRVCLPWDSYVIYLVLKDRRLRQVWHWSPVAVLGCFEASCCYP